MKLAALKAAFHVGRDWYAVATMKIASIVEHFPLVDNSELPVADRTQRRLQKSRLPNISQYMTGNKATYLFPSLIIGVRSMKFSPVTCKGVETGTLGILEVPFDKGTLIIDGQHRIGGFGRAIAEAEIMGKDEISLMFVKYENVQQAQSYFSDTNRFTKPTPQGLNIEFSQTPQAEVTRNVIEQVSIFGDRGSLVERERGGSLSLKSAKAFSNVAIDAALHEHFFAQLEAKFPDMFPPETQANIKAKTKLGVELFEYLGTLFAPWRNIAAGGTQAEVVRANIISTHGVSIRAFGVVAGKAYIQCAESRDVNACWKRKLNPLKSVDYRRTNPEFIRLGIVRDVDGKSSVRSDRQARENMIQFLASAINLEQFAPDTEALTRLKRAIRPAANGAKNAPKNAPVAPVPSARRARKNAAQVAA